MLKIEGAVPCSICGEHPILQGGVASHRARLVCPNYKSETTPHGNLSCETQHLPRVQYVLVNVQGHAEEVALL